MEIATAAAKLCAAKLLCSAESEVSVEGEWSIPEYLPEVFKIVRTTAEPVVVQKLAAGTRVTVDGYARLTVLYQSGGDRRLYASVQKLPFSKQFELKEPLGEQGAVLCAVQPGYLNCRAASRRKLDARGALTLRLRVLSQSEQTVAGELTAAGLFCAQGAADCAAALADEEKQFTLEELLGVDFEGCASPAVLRCDAGAVVESAVLEEGRAVLTGYVNVAAAFDISSDEEYRVKRAGFRLPFSQVLDLPLSGSGYTAVPRAGVVACALEPAEDGNASCSVTCALGVRVFERRAVSFVRDAFAADVQLELKTLQTTVCAGARTIAEGFGVRFAGDKPQGRPVDWFVTGSTAALARADGRDVVAGSAVFVGIFCGEDGEAAAAEFPFEYSVPLAEGFAGTPAAELQTVFTSLECFDAAAAVNVKCEGLVTGAAYDLVPLTAVTGAGEAGPREKTRPGAALCIYYAAAGERVFDIAREFGTSPAEIAQQNDLADEALDRARPLLIPIVPPAQGR